MGSGITFTNGKIGNAATFPNNCNSCIYMDGLKLQTGSWCTWIKVLGEGSGTSQRIISEGRDTGSIGTNIFVNKAGTTLTAHTHKRVLQTTVSLNTWYHVAITFGNGIFSLYINGNLLSSISYTEDSDYAQSNDKLVLGKMSYSYTITNNYFPLNGQLNDVRIYDHCLSPREVKEISKGLVLHYPLSASGENLARNTYNKLEYHTDDFSAVSKTIGYPISGFQGKELLLAASEKGLTLSYDISIPFIYRNTSQTLQRCGCYIAFTIKNNSTGTTIYYYAHHSQAGIATAHNTYSKTNSLNSISSSATASAPDTSFNGHYSRTIFPNEFSSLSDFFANPDNYTVTGGTSINTEIRGAYIKGECTISNVKLELGSIATPWIPNPSDTEYSTLGFNDGIEYDVSGYNHNGTKYGTLTYSSDTPRYNTSAVFNGTDNCIQFPFNDFCTNGDVFTMNIWWKKTVLGSKSYETLIGGPSGFEMDTRSGAAQALSLYMASVRGGNAYSPFNMNEWYMVTLVNDGTNELYYVNGTLVKTIEKKNMPSGNYYVGAWKNETGQNFNGFMSDFRFYKTALSADDILELYHTPMTLANNGTLLTSGEFQE